MIAIPASSEPLRIEGAAAALWESLARPRAIEELVAEVAANAAVPSADLMVDVRRALGVLSEAGLVECS